LNVSFFVSLTSFAAAFGALIGILVLLAVPFVRLPITVTAPVSFTLDTPAGILGGRPGWGFEFRETPRPPAPIPPRVQRIAGSMRVPVSSRWFIAFNGISLIVILFFVAYTLGKVRDVLRTLVRDKTPFVAANAARLRFIGLAVIAGSLAVSAIVFVENTWARANLRIPGVTFDLTPNIDFGTIFFGLLILIIAEVFRAGTQLDEDQSLTI
jgi:hypothetical protein